MSKMRNSIFSIQVGRVGGLVLALALAVPAMADEKSVRELTLNDCIGLALENNLDLKIERINRQVVQKDEAIARGGYDPELSISAKRRHETTAGESAGTASGALALLGSETENDAWTTAIGGRTWLGGLRYELGAHLGDSSGTRDGNPFDTSTGSAGITLTQPLLQGFKIDSTRYSVAVAGKQSREAALQLETRLQELLSEVETAWYDLIQARGSIRVQKEAVRLATQLYEDNRRKVQIGTLSVLDEKQSESQAASARAALSVAQRAYAEAQNRLKQLVLADHRHFRQMEINAVGDVTAQPVMVEPEAAGFRALEQRTDLRQARITLERQGLAVAYQRNQTLPSLDLVGGYGVAASQADTYGDALDQMQSADEPYWTLGVTLTFPLGNRAAQHRHAQSLATAEKQRLELKKQEEIVLVEVDNAVAAVQTGFAQVQATKDARVYAEQALEAEQRKLENGRSTSFVVLQLQRDLTQARNNEIQALADYNRQISGLALAEGAMLERHGVSLATE
ncbi:MAG: TolC family protein [Kiritimatiellae bacterium]|nr:TolC family protein [Kiritimatiellia bacterium]